MAWDEADQKLARQTYDREWAYILRHERDGSYGISAPELACTLLYLIAYDLHRIAEGRDDDR